ncbi:MAG TPA: hypothetical protein VJ599_01040 [Nitrososphaeraceae archaeon]|nr:hypothetical protein [Nitrososphaeraceae archaeon]
MFKSVQDVFCLRQVLVFLVLLFLCTNISSQYTYGHFFGTTKNIGNYQIIFAPYPSLPFAGDNSTLLNFSILDKDNQNLNNISASLLIKTKENGSIIQNIPFKFYEFSDITIPYTFKDIGAYQVSLSVRISDDPGFSQNPISADFDISATDPNQIIPTNELILYYLIPALAVIAIIVVYLRRKNKI